MTEKAIAIYELEASGPQDEYEATGEIHFYCSVDHANRHAIAEGFRTSANFSEPQLTTDALPGITCEWCGAVIIKEK